MSFKIQILYIHETDSVNYKNILLYCTNDLLKILMKIIQKVCTQESV